MMPSFDYQWVSHLQKLLAAAPREDRTGVGTTSIFAPDPIRVDLSLEFPALTAKRLAFKSAMTELLWMMRGESTTEYLHHHGVTIWDDWADDDGDLGPVYGAQWRSTGAAASNFADYVDQMADLVKGLRENPFSRRHIVSAWQPLELAGMALPPCPVMFQVNVRPDDAGVPFLDMHMYQRSADWFLGVPFDVAVYAALTHVLAGFAGCRPGKLTVSYGDTHLYLSHREQAQQAVDQWLTGRHDGVSQLELAAPPNVFDDLDEWVQAVGPGNFRLVNYNPLPAIAAPVAV